MRFRTLPHLLLGLACSSFISSALAQTHFCIAGDLEHLSAAQVTECRAKMTGVREAVKRRGAPAGWHFVVVCDEAGWSDYTSFVAPFAGSLQDAAFHTDGSMGWTFVRGSRMEPANVEDAEVLLTTALRGIPNHKTEPRNIPNPQRVLREPSLSIARVEAPQLP